jgi:alkylated DNA nucleotide flippase Atl1
MSELKNIVKQFVNMIPAGRVTNYGSVAAVVSEKIGSKITAQLIGWTLSGMYGDELDGCAWQRVVAKNGAISTLKLGDRGWIQQEILRAEGVEVSAEGVDMSKYGWQYTQ